MSLAILYYFYGQCTLTPPHEFFPWQLVMTTRGDVVMPSLDHRSLFKTFIARLAVRVKGFSLLQYYYFSLAL